jgi:hypothetical protein
MKVEMTLKRGWAVADDAKQIGHHAELFPNGFK